jgi:sugar phosphate permease
MPCVSSRQAFVTHGFAGKPPMLAAEGAIHFKPHFADGRVAGQLADTQWLVLDELILDAVFETTLFHGVLMLLTGICLVCMDTGTRL